MITEDYVSFETAKLLKEKGFRCDTLHYYYDKDGDLLFSAWRVDASKNEFAAPTLQMAMKWLREMHKINIEIITYLTKDKSMVYGNRIIHSNVVAKEIDTAYNSYEQACEVAIKYCLENLI